MIRLVISLAVIFLPSWTSAAVQVAGENTTTDGAYAADASNSDLVNAGSSTLASGPTYSAAPFFGPAANNDGTVGTANTTADITFWLSATPGQQFTITYALDTSVNTIGYDITSIQTINGWTSNSGNQKNQNYTVAVSTVGSATFTDIATVAYLPFSSANTTGSTKVTVTEDATGILASGVDEVRFTYTVPASGGNQPSPTIREIDVFGIPTPSGPDTTPPTLSGIADDRGGGPVAPNTLVTYTVTFNEDMDGGTVSDADFDNAGTSTISIGAVTETSPGVFRVPVTPTTAGTLQLRILLGATLSDAAGNPLGTSSAIVDDTTITVDASSLLVTTENSLGAPFASTAWAGNLSATDLINAGRPTLGSATVSTAFFGPNGIHDGAAIAEDTTTNTFFSTGSLGDNFPAVATYDLDVSTNTEGYHLTSIESFMGWHSNSGTHGNQTYEVEVSLVGSPDYVSLATVNYEPFGTADSNHHESHVVIADSSGVLASGVDSIRFTFSTPANGGTSPGTVVREIDVHGYAVGGGTPSTLTITAPASRQVIQREVGNSGDIPVGGTFTGTPDHIEARAVAPAPTKDIGAIWFIGDSITQSNADGDGNGSPRKSLYDLLVADGYTFSYTGHFTANVDGLPATGGTAAANLYHYHSGISGSCIGVNSNGRTNMTAGISGWWNQGRLASTRPNIVLIMLGTNDLDLNDNVSDAPNRIKILVDTIFAQVGRGDPAPAIYVSRIPPNTGSAPEARRVIDFNNALPSIVTTLQNEGKDVTLVDHWTPINADTAGLMRDSLHTNSAGNEVLASQWFDAIDARFDVAPSGTTTAWQIIDAAPAGGTFSGTLSDVSAGGWYQLEVRSVTGGVPGTEVVREKIGVGDIYVTCGQSNSANFGSPAGTVTDDRVSAWNYAGGAWTKAADPMPGANGGGGSVWPRLGDLLAARDDVPIAFACLGQGGTSISQWVPPGGNYPRVAAAMNGFPANGFRGVLWHQGESDSLASTAPATYQSRLESIIAQSRIDADWAVPWFIAEVGFHPSSVLSQEEPVVAGQRRAIFNDPLVFPGPVTDDFHLEGKLSDGVHFNGAGLADHAAQWADVLGGSPPLVPKNGDFEANASIADGATAAVNTTASSSPSVIGWRALAASGEAVADGSCGYRNPDDSSYTGTDDSGGNGGVPANMSGRHVAFLSDSSAGAHFLQTRRAMAEAAMTYTLTVALGVRNNPSNFGRARLEILSNGVLTARANFDKPSLDALRGDDSSGSFTDASVSWTTGEAVAANQALGIRIVKLDGAGTVLDFDNVRFTAVPADDFSSWIGDPAFGLDPADRGFGDDPDLDGLASGLEGFFGTNPGQFNVGLAELATNGTTITFTHPQNDDPLTNVSGFYQWSLNLVDWFDSGSGPGGGPSVTLVPVTVATTTTVTATASEPLEQLFLRAGAMQN